MCLEEVSERVDSVVTGEAEGIWAQVLQDARQGRMQRRYDGGLARIDEIRPARHDLLQPRYAFGAIQTTRGCPLNCSFCSVTSFNGASYRQRPVADVVREFQRIPEKRVLLVDDNLIGTRAEHIARAKALFRAMAEAKLGKQWIGQATINFADDEELLELAAQAGCKGVFIGFESPSPEGLRELGKKINLVKGRDFRASVERIHRHGMLVVGSFIIGLDADQPGIGGRIAAAATQYGIDNLNALFLTPLPGTQLWGKMVAEQRLAVDDFPLDWKYYTLTFPVAHYRHLSLDQVIAEMDQCGRKFYSIPRILGRAGRSLWQRRGLLISLVASLSYRSNLRVDRHAYAEFKRARGSRHLPPAQPAETDAFPLGEEALQSFRGSLLQVLTPGSGQGSRAFAVRPVHMAEAMLEASDEGVHLTKTGALCDRSDGKFRLPEHVTRLIQALLPQPTTKAHAASLLKDPPETAHRQP